MHEAVFGSRHVEDQGIHQTTKYRQESVMRQLMTGLVAAAAVVTVSAAPAMACGGGLFTSCSPCGAQAYVSPCGGYGYGYGGFYGGAELLSEPQYFYANQGPVYGGPGMYAPVPTYQESAVSGWGAYQSGEPYYGYNGGHYANATNHYYDGMPAVEGPAMYHYAPHHYYRPWRRHWYGGYAPHVSHYGYGYRGYHAPYRSMRYGYRAGYHAGSQYERVMRRYY
jgi:hypothetical protein